MEIHAIGIDLGKTVFHLVGVDSSGTVVVRKRCFRTQLLAYTANLRVHRIGMKACSGSHFLGRPCERKVRFEGDYRANGLPGGPTRAKVSPPESLAGQLHGLGAMSSEMHPDNREPRTASDQSYPMRIDLDYRVMGVDGVLDRGHGQTKAMSRTTVWLKSDKTLRAGVPIELALTWPVLLDNKIPLKLVIYGKTVSVYRSSINIPMIRARGRCVGSMGPCSGLLFNCARVT
jgi:hypothetical protein